MAAPFFGRFATFDAATIDSKSDEVATLPVSNLQNIQPGKVWRADSGLDKVWVVLDLGSAVAVNLVGLLATNVSSAATLRVMADATLATVQGAAPIGPFGYDSGTINATPKRDLPADWGPGPVLHFPSTAQTFRYWRIELHDSGNADGYVQAGRGIIDAAWQPARNVQHGWSWRTSDESPRVTSVGGQTFFDVRAKRRFQEGDLKFLDGSDMFDAGAELMRGLGTSHDVVLVADPSLSGRRLAQQTIHGVFEDLEPVVNRVADVYDWRFRIREIL